MTDKINWTAIYKNGDRIKHQAQVTYDKLERKGLEAFEVSWMDTPVVTVHIQDNQQLIWRRRNEMKSNTPTLQGQPTGYTRVVYLCGWRETINGKDTQTITYIFDRGDFPPEIHISGKFDRERNRFFYEPDWREFEKLESEKNLTPNEVEQK